MFVICTYRPPTRWRFVPSAHLIASLSLTSRLRSGSLGDLEGIRNESDWLSVFENLKR